MNRQAESSSLSYGWIFHLTLLPTAPRGYRSYVQLQAGERMPEEDFHLSDLVRFQAHNQPQRCAVSSPPSANLSQ